MVEHILFSKTSSLFIRQHSITVNYGVAVSIAWILNPPSANLAQILFALNVSTLFTIMAKRFVLERDDTIKSVSVNYT
jgi:hypothetical protein